MAEVLTRVALNRMLLARQHLLARTTRPVLEVVEHLVGLQAQNPPSPYLALWSRVEGFSATTLGQALVAREVVRIGCLRATIHLVSARDVAPIRAVVQPVMERSYLAPGEDRNKLRRGLESVDKARLIARARDLLAHGPLTNAVLGGALAAEWPDADATEIGNAARALVPLVQIPPRGVWGASGQATWDLVDRWLSRSIPEADEAAVDALVLRYLRAFGPATAADVQTWSGLAGVAEILERLSKQLLTFSNERGQRLWDVPDGLRPDAATPAPPRFLPDYDNVALSHADRTRIVSEPLKKRLGRPNGVVPGTVLVDGFVRGIWDFEKPKKADAGRLTVTLMEPIDKRARAPMIAEAQRFAAFLGDGKAATVEVVEDIA